MIHVVNWRCVTYYLDLCIYCNMISIAAAVAKSLQSCQTLCDPVDGSPPGSSVRGILQARTLEWVAISFSMISTEAIFIRLFDYSMYYCVYLLHCAWNIYSFPTVSGKKKKRMLHEFACYPCSGTMLICILILVYVMWKWALDILPWVTANNINSNVQVIY